MTPVNNPAGTAAVLSFIFSGLGQLYNGQLVKGLTIILFSVISIIILLSGGLIIGFWLLEKVLFPGQIIAGGILFSIGLVLICVLGIYSIFDAYHNASPDTKNT